MPNDTPTEAVRRLLVDHDLVRAFALRIKHKRGWRMSDDAAHSRVLHLLNDYGGQRGLWLDDAIDAIELAGEDPVSEFFGDAAARGEARALRRRLEELERPRMMSVRPRERVNRRTG